MNYYKIYTNDTFIGIACSGNFLTYKPQTNHLIITDENVGQFVEYKNQLYRDTWMKPVSDELGYNFINARIQSITREEYVTLRTSIEQNEEIEIITQEEELYVPEEQANITLDFIRASKINEMSYICRQTIEAGFDLPMTDGEIHHFSLSQQDQLNLMTFSVLAETEDTIPYHADGEESRFYTAAEIKLIINTANTFKNYQLAYYNSLKNYINALETIEEIAAITYGTPIPEEYKSDVLKVLE